MEANFYALLNSLTRIIVMLAATWRMTSLVCNEEGPFAIFEKNRNFFRHLHKTKAWFRATHLYSGIRCEWCTSIWISFPFLVMYLYFPTETLVYATALTFSTGTIFLKYVVQTLSAVKERQEALAKLEAHFVEVQPVDAERLETLTEGIHWRDEAIDAASQRIEELEAALEIIEGEIDDLINKALMFPRRFTSART